MGHFGNCAACLACVDDCGAHSEPVPDNHVHTGADAYICSEAVGHIHHIDGFGLMDNQYHSHIHNTALGQLFTIYSLGF
jgi:hypothetical protein